jgi:antitoxin ParD1/3/4
MNVVLDSKTEELVRRKLETGRFRDESEVVQEAVRLLDERDRRMQQLRDDIAIGREQAQRGQLIDWTPEFLDQLSSEAEENARLGKPIKSAVKP